MTVRRAAPFLIAAAVGAYAASLRNGFAWDHGFLIVKAPLRTLLDVLLGPDAVGTYYRPLNRASYLLDARLFGLHPRLARITK